MERGIRRGAIYEDEEDYQAFLAIMKSAQEKYGCTLHAYCLMTNHYHLLLETSESCKGRIGSASGRLSMEFVPHDDRYAG